MICTLTATEAAENYRIARAARFKAHFCGSPCQDRCRETDRDFRIAQLDAIHFYHSEQHGERHASQVLERAMHSSIFRDDEAADCVRLIWSDLAG